MSDYDRVLVKVTDASAIEPLGTKQKWWFDDHRKLFKANYKERGEDWAEVVVTRFCEILGLPHASYILATANIKRDKNRWEHQRGVITESFFTRPKETLIDGDQLLVEQDPAYPSASRYKVSQYTISAVANAISNLQLPPSQFCPDLPPKVETALGVYAGYIMLDALVANQDRHQQHWGGIDDGVQRRLSPTFDHGACLAPAESDKKRRDRLDSKDAGYSVESFAARAKSPFWNTTGTEKLGLVDAWLEFAGYAEREAEAWVNRLERLEKLLITSCFNEVPDDIMTETTREFCAELVSINLERMKVSWKTRV